MQQALVQYAGMAIAFGLGWVAHWPAKDREMANCPHHGWDETRQLAVSWLHELEINGRQRIRCSYCGRLFPAELTPSAGWSAPATQPDRQELGPGAVA